MIGNLSLAKHPVQHRLQVRSAMPVTWKKLQTCKEMQVRAHNLDSGRRQTLSISDVSSQKPQMEKTQRNTLGFFLKTQESLIGIIYLPCLCLFQTWTLVPLLNYRRNLQMLWEKNENQYNSNRQLIFYIYHFSRDAQDGAKPIFAKMNDVHQVVLHLAIFKLVRLFNEYSLVMSLMSSAMEVWFARELLAACMCGNCETNCLISPTVFAWCLS